MQTTGKPQNQKQFFNKPIQSWITSYTQRRQRTTCPVMINREQYEEGKELLMVQSCYGMCMMAANGTGKTFTGKKVGPINR